MTFDPKWNARYAGADAIFGDQPNDFLRAESWRIAPAGRVLTIGEGDGRNALWLARQGFTVTAVEGSSVAVEKAEAAARAAGLSITFHCADLVEWAWPQAAFDAVVAIFVHFTPDIRPSLHARAAAAVAPGGVMIVECFHPSQAGGASGGPPAEMLCDAATLADDFAPLTPLVQLEGTVRLDEGPRHQGPAQVARYVGWRD